MMMTDCCSDRCRDCPGTLQTADGPVHCSCSCHGLISPLYPAPPLKSRGRKRPSNSRKRSRAGSR
jgi:hypothetical protein